MSDKKAKNNTLKKISSAEVTDFLMKTGFVFEMVVAELLKDMGFDVSVNQYFQDLETDKKREIDIVATKTVNKIKISLIVECKQSLKHTWVFVCSDKKPSRYYKYVKHLPNIKKMHSNKIFNHMNVLNFKVPIAQNNTIFDTYSKKPVESNQIQKALESLPKALVDVATKSNDKTIFIPIVVFSGQIFSAKYDGKLVIKEESPIYCSTEFESESYKPEGEPMKAMVEIEKIGQLAAPNMMTYDERKIAKMKTVYEKLGKNYAIAFVSESKLKKYIKTIEKDVEKISTRKWSYDVNKYSSKF